MARETKVGLIVGLGVILFVSIFVSDYLSVPQQHEALGQENLPNYVEQTTNQPEFVLTREEETAPATQAANPRDFAAASLDNLEQYQGVPTEPESITIGSPPFAKPPPSLARSTTPRQWPMGHVAPSALRLPMTRSSLAARNSLPNAERPAAIHLPIYRMSRSPNGN